MHLLKDMRREFSYSFFTLSHRQYSTDITTTLYSTNRTSEKWEFIGEMLPVLPHMTTSCRVNGALPLYTFSMLSFNWEIICF